MPVFQLEDLKPRGEVPLQHMLSICSKFGPYNPFIRDSLIYKLPQLPDCEKLVTRHPKE